MTPAFPWPNHHQCAVAITVNFDGESVERRATPDRPLWGRDSYGRYPANIGARRILDVLRRYNVRATFFIPGWDAEHCPAVMESIAAAGHEVAGHGYVHEDFSRLSAAEQRAVFERSEDLFRRVFGAPPVGWRAPGGLMMKETRRLLAERGYRYDSSFCDDDVPYVVATEHGQRLVELPVFSSASDRPYYLLRRPPALVGKAWREEFDAAYQVGGLFTLTLHPRADDGSGRAVRLSAVESILQAIQDTPRIWQATCGDVADWALSVSALEGSAPLPA